MHHVAALRRSNNRRHRRCFSRGWFSTNVWKWRWQASDRGLKQVQRNTLRFFFFWNWVHIVTLSHDAFIGIMCPLLGRWRHLSATMHWGKSLRHLWCLPWLWFDGEVVAVDRWILLYIIYIYTRYLYLCRCAARLCHFQSLAWQLAKF